MSPLNVLLSANVLGALTLVLVAGLFEPVITYQVNRWFEGNHVFHWAWDTLGAPLLRTLIIVAFVLCAYPALFSLSTAPTIGELLAAGSLRLSGLINVLFLCSLALPVLPLFRRRPALVVPIQGLIAVAMVFGWFVHDLGAKSITPWPGLGAAVAIGAMAVISHRIAADLGVVIGQWLDQRRHTSGYDLLVPNALELLCQTPVLLYYGLNLGRQIGI